MNTNARDIIPVFKPASTELELQYVSEVLESGWWGYGPRAKRLETMAASYLGCSEVLAVTSGTAALHMALVLANVGPGDEVILPSTTWVSTGLAVQYTGATPVFVDVDDTWLSLDPVGVENSITARTKAIIIVHFSGLPGAISEISAIAGRHGVVVIEDAAHAFGAEYEGRKIGSHSDFVCFSMNAVKNVAAGEGGILAMKDVSLRPRAEKLSWLGVSKQTYELATDKPDRMPTKAIETGWKYRLSDISAAVAQAQLERLDQNNEMRQHIVEQYNTQLADIPDVRLPVSKNNASSSHHMYAIRVPAAQRDALRGELAAKNIVTSVHYPSLNDAPAFATTRTGDTPTAALAAKELVTLPMYPELTKDQVVLICGSVRCFFDHIVEC